MDIDFESFASGRGGRGWMLRGRSCDVGKLFTVALVVG